MLAFPSMLTDAAKKAGMKTPDLSEDEDFDPHEFTHFQVYCTVQLGRRITWGNHWRNAEIVAAIPDDKIKTVTPQDLDALGFDP